MIGRSFARYQVLEELGAGGMGRVFRAHDPSLGRDVALKVLATADFPDPKARLRLVREARLAASLSHPHICAVYEVGVADGQDYIAMEYVRGQSLRALAANGPLSVPDCIRYGTQVAEALAHAHRQGVVHRDLKADNVMITPDGTAKVLDFGLATRYSGEDLSEVATRTDAPLTETGAVVGTLPYMAPEQLRGEEAGPRSDLYALGAMLYELTTGRRPFESAVPTTLIANILYEHPLPTRQLRRSAPRGLERIIHKCLEKDPKRRFPSADVLLEDLRQEQGGGTRSWRTAAIVGAATALLLVVGFYGIRQFSGGGPRKVRDGKIMLAVLPFTNLSGDSGQEFFSDGLTEELIAQLGRLQPDRLGVIARTSVMTYKGTHERLDAIGRELNVQYVLEGSVRRDSSEIRVTAQLIQVSDQTHLWAENYDRKLANVLAVQSDVARKVSRSLSLELLPGERDRLEKPRVVNPEAYELYLRGRDLRWRGTKGEAIRSYRRAIELDSEYALAYSALAWEVSVDDDTPPDERTRTVEWAARRATELDPTLAEPYYALAFLRARTLRDLKGADAANRKALELGESDAHAQYLCAVNLISWGRTAQALEHSRRAVELDPLAFDALNATGYIRYYARRYDEAVEYLQRAIRASPDLEAPHHNLGRAYLQLGEFDKALAEFQESIRLAPEGRPGLDLAGLACTRLAMGQRQAADTLLRELLHSTDPVRPWALAEVYAALGEKSRALDQLDEAYAQRVLMTAYIRVEPLLDPIRNEPRFAALVERMNFPEG